MDSWHRTRLWEAARLFTVLSAAFPPPGFSLLLDCLSPAAHVRLFSHVSFHPLLAILLHQAAGFSSIPWAAALCSVTFSDSFVSTSLLVADTVSP